MPLLIFLILLIGLPLLEIAVFIQVGDAIGLWPTLGAVVLGTMIGVSVVRAQGISVLGRLRSQVDAGQPPEREVFEAFCLVLAGLFILLPGFVTDSLGILLMLPPLRGLLFNAVVGYAKKRGATHRRSVVIEGEFEEVDEPNGGKPGPQGPKQLP
jgi:UPF0716 protein FxsA